MLALGSFAPASGVAAAIPGALTPAAGATAREGADEGGDRMSEGETPTLHDVIATAVQGEVEKRQFPLVSAHLQKCSNRLASRIEALQKSNQRLESTKKEIEELKQIRIPKGVRPFNLSYDSPLLDTTVLQEDLVVTWTIEKGVTVREAKKQVYIKSILHQKELDAIIMAEQRSSSRLATKKDTFVRECSEVPGCELELDVFKELDLDFDESSQGPGSLPKLDKAKLESKAVSLYFKVVEAAAKQKKQQADSKLKAEQKINKVVEAVKKRSPEELFEEAVSKEVDYKLQAMGIAGKQTKKAAKPPSTHPSTSATLFVHRLAGRASNEDVKKDVTAENQSPSKNGVSPAKGGGKSKEQGAAPKGKGKGKTKAQAKAKAGAKGGGKPTSKGNQPNKGQKGKGYAQPGKGKGGAKNGSKGQGNGKGRGGTRST